MRSQKQNWGAWRVLLASGASIQTAHATSELVFGAVPGYSEGQYGTSATTTIEYLPFYLKYRDDDLSLKLTVPWIPVESAGAVVPAAW